MKDGNYIFIVGAILCLTLIVVFAPLTDQRTPEEKLAQRQEQVESRISKFTTADGLECVRYSLSSTAGISCNWPKFNIEQAGEL